MNLEQEVTKLTDAYFGIQRSLFDIRYSSGDPQLSVQSAFIRGSPTAVRTSSADG